MDHAVVVLQEEFLQLFRLQKRGDLAGDDHPCVEAPRRLFHHCPGRHARGKEDAHKFP